MNDVEELKKLCERLINERQRRITQCKGTVQYYVDKVRSEKTSIACDQLGVAVYELHTSEFLLRELKRVKERLARAAPANPHKPVLRTNQPPL